MSTIKVTIGPSIRTEILDALEGAVYDATHGRSSQEIGTIVIGLQRKLEGAGRVVELTHEEARRLAWELDYLQDRIAEWNPGLAKAAEAKETEIHRLLARVV